MMGDAHEGSLYSYMSDGCQRISYCHNDDLNEGEEAAHGDGTGDGVASGNSSNNNDNEALVVCKNVLLGCHPEKADDYRPYVFEPTWCVYIKGQNNEDMGRYVRQVTFRMSPRLPLRLHVADSAPFEITEVLSTDFPVELKVDYLDPSMTSTTYVYKPDDIFDGNFNVDKRMNFMGHERRDKMFFMNPPLSLQRCLSTAPNILMESTSQKHAQRYRPEEHKPNALRQPAVPRPIFNVRQTPT